MGVETVRARPSSSSATVVKARALRNGGGHSRPPCRTSLTEMLNGRRHEPEARARSPSVILVIGVNGVGKTTTIGKLAHQPAPAGEEGPALRGRYVPRRRCRAARDLGRSAPMCEHRPPGRGRGPGRRGVTTPSAPPRPAARDVILCDTAGRLHNKAQPDERAAENLPASSTESCRTPDRETLLVLDGTTGQNGLLQAKQFKRGRRRHRHRPDEAGRHGQGRHCHCRGGHAADSRQAHRRRRADRTILCPSSPPTLSRRCCEPGEGRSRYEICPGKPECP